MLGCNPTGRGSIPCAPTMMNEYYRLMSAIILSGIYEQDSKNVVNNNKAYVPFDVLNAKTFVESELFDYYCELIGLDGKRMRKLTPDMALQKFKQIVVRCGGRGIVHDRHKEVIVDAMDSMDVDTLTPKL